MFESPWLLESVNEEAPELLEAATTILEFADVFDEAALSHDDDGVTCVSVAFSLPYPIDEPKPGESWTAAVYGDEAEVWHLRCRYERTQDHHGAGTDDIGRVHQSVVAAPRAAG